MFAHRSTAIVGLLSAGILAVLGPLVVSAEEPLLERDVLPILTKNCMGCHGGLRQEAGLDLRTLPGMLKGGESGPAIEPRHVEGSQLWQQIASDDMPAGDDREKLSADDKAIIKAWIDAGLPTVYQRQQNVDSLLPGDERHKPQEVSAAIDQHINRFLVSADLKSAAISDDDEFLRRVYLDLTGNVPTASLVTEFLDDEAADKRPKLIDALLATPEFGEQFGRTWRDWVCPPELPSSGNAGGQPYSEAKSFGQWLGKKFAAGESWDRITHDILTVKGEIKQNPQVIFFGLVGQEEKVTADGAARAVASLFMGVQLQCARCHDDPYRAWSQQEHWGLAAFFDRVQGNFKKLEVGKGTSETPGEISIPASAFRNAGTTVKAAFPGDSEFQPHNDEDIRKPFVDWLIAKDNPYFARAFANRVWFYLFSRGIVNPIDDFRELNPPSHPGLIKLLADEFVVSGFDVKHVFRCICNSQTYQRTSRVESGTDSRAREVLTTAFGRMPMRLMTADMLYDALKRAYGDPQLDLRTSVTHSTVGMAAPVADAWLEFQRRFRTNEEDATDFTHGIAQMLTMINHPRLLDRSKALDDFLNREPQAATEKTIEWLYLSTLSRRPTDEEAAEANEFVEQGTDAAKAYDEVLWMLVNRSEFILVR